MKKHLIIHPEDNSTDFLTAIYQNIPASCRTVVRDHSLPARAVNELIEAHDRIIMLGHGMPEGLLSFTFPPLVISEEHAPALRAKRESIFIWCHADEFVQRHGLGGFFSGMFISETYEAGYHGISVSKTAVEKSNALFASLVGQWLHVPQATMLAKVKMDYQGDCPVLQFNRARMGVLAQSQVAESEGVLA